MESTRPASGSIAAGPIDPQRPNRFEVLDRWHVDNYLFHLEREGKIEGPHGLHALLAAKTDDGANAWHALSESRDRLDAYLTELRRAWQLAERRPEDAGLQCRYALMLASLVSLATNLPAELVPLLVDRGVWSPPQAMAYARQMLDSRQRALALTGLGPYLALPDLRHALLAIRGDLAGPRDGAILQACMAESAAFGAELLRQVLRLQYERLVEFRGLSVDDALGHDSLTDECVDAARAAAPSWSEARLREGLAFALSLEDMSAQRAILESIVPPFAALGGDCPREALDVLQGIRDRDARASLMGSVLRHFPRAKLRRVVSVELVQARAESYALDRARWLTGLVPFVPRDDRLSVAAEAFAAAEAVEYEPSRARLMLDLIPWLPAGQRVRAVAAVLAAASRDENPGWRRLELLVPLAGVTRRRAARSRASDAGHGAGDAGVAAARSNDVAEEAVRVLLSESPYFWRGYLPRLAPHLTRRHWRQLLAGVASGNTSQRHQGLSILVGLLPAPLLPEAVELVLAGEDPRQPRPALRLLASRLAPAQVEDLLFDALADDSPSTDAEREQGVLADALAPFVSESGLRRAIEAAWPKRGWKSMRVHVLAALVPQLARFGHAAEAVAALRDPALSTGEVLSSALVSLATLLPEELHADALDMVEQMKATDYRDRTHRDSALVALAPHLSSALLRRALRVLARVGDEERLDALLGTYAEYLARLSAADDGLAVLGAIRDVASRARAATTCAAYVAEEERGRWLATAQTACDAVTEAATRADLLAALVPLWPQSKRAAAVDALLSAVAEVSGVDQQVHSLLAPVAQVTDPEAARLREEAIALVLASRSPDEPRPLEPAEESWLRRVESLLRRGGVRQVVASLLVACALRDGSGGVDALAGLAEHLQGGERARLLGEADAMTDVIADPVLAARLTVAIAPLRRTDGGADIVGRALGRILLLPPSERVSLLEDLAAWLPEDERSEVVSHLWAATGGAEDDALAASWLSARGVRGHAKTQRGKLRRRAALWTAEWLPLRLLDFPRRRPALADQVGKRAYLLLRIRPDRGASKRARAALLAAEHASSALRERLLETALAAAREEPYEESRAALLAEVAAKLPALQRHEVVTEARGLIRNGAESPRGARILWDLAMLAPDDCRDEAIAEALDVALREPNPVLRLNEDVLENMAAAVREESLRAVLALLDERGNEAWRRAIFLPHLARLGHADEALAAIERVSDTSDRGRAYARIATFLDVPLLYTALEAAVALPDDRGKSLMEEVRNPGGQRVRAIAILLSHLAQLGEVAEATGRAKNLLADNGWWPIYLCNHVDQLPADERDELLVDALAVARTMTHTESRAEVLAELSDHLLDLSVEMLDGLWRATLRDRSHAGRSELLSDLRALGTLLARVGGVCGLTEVGHAADDVYRWWP